MRLILDKIKVLFLFIFSVVLYAQDKTEGHGLGGAPYKSVPGHGLGGPPGTSTPIDSYEIILIVVALSFVVGYYLYRRRQLSLEK